MRKVLSLILALAVAVPVAMAAEAAKPADKPAEAKPADAAKPAVPELPERVIEKKDADYAYALTLKPGNLKPNRVATAKIVIQKNLEVPDPITGDTAPVKTTVLATLKAPDVQKGKKIEPGKSTTYQAWPVGDPGNYEFHFTPPDDGIYELTVAAAKAGDDSVPTFSVAFRLGVGTMVNETEQSVGTTAKRAARHPVGQKEAGEAKIDELMAEIGQRYLDLEEKLAHPPAKGPQGDAAAEARAIAALFAKTKGQSPHRSDGDEFDKLAATTGSQFEALASAAEGKDRNAPRATFSKIEMNGCAQCHAKFRFEVTDDVSSWPNFQQKKSE